MSFFMALIKPIAYLSLPLVALRVIATKSPMTRYYLRLALYLSTLGVCSVWGVIIAVSMRLFGNPMNVNYFTARSFYNVASRVMNIRLVVSGEHYLGTRPAVLVGNHQSMLDIIYLGRIFPRHASIMAKRELRWMPGLGQYLSFSGAVFVDRSNKKDAVQMLAEAGEQMKKQQTSLWLFPEGTRSMREKDDLLPFKKGAFHLAIQSGLPVIPVVCENYWRLYRTGIFTSGVLEVRVLPPIPTTNLTADDVNELSNRTRDLMIDTLRDISAARTARAESAAPPRTYGASEEEITALPPQPPPSVDIREIVAEGSTSIADVRKRTISTVSSVSKDGMETEEDEGMVLVGRP